MNDVGATVAIYISILDQRLDVVEVTAHLDAAAAVGVFAWLDDPERLAKFRELVQNCALVGILRIVVELLEFQELRVVQSFLNVVSQRQIVMVLFTYGLVVHLHVVEDGFFVAQVIVIFHFTVVKQVVRGRIFLLFVFFVLSLLGTTAEYSTIFCSAAVSRSRILFFELDF